MKEWRLENIHLRNITLLHIVCRKEWKQDQQLNARVDEDGAEEEHAGETSHTEPEHHHGKYRKDNEVWLHEGSDQLVEIQCHV